VNEGIVEGSEAVRWNWHERKSEFRKLWSPTCVRHRTQARWKV